MGITREEASYFGLQVFNPQDEGFSIKYNIDFKRSLLEGMPVYIEVPVSMGLETNHPDWKYQDNGNIYFLDDVFTGENCKTPIRTSNLWANNLPS